MRETWYLNQVCPIIELPKTGRRMNNMCELERWLTDSSAPSDYRERLAKLLELRTCDEATGQSVFRIDAEIASIVSALREYMEALSRWEGEGGR